MPIGKDVSECDNEICKIYAKDGVKFIEFKRLVTKKGKEMSEIHSGNENEINLGAKLPKFSFLREEIR